MSEIKRGITCVDGYHWPAYKVLQQLADRRRGTTWWFRLKLWLGISEERRKS
jgi:hypothetical protein